MHKNKHVVLNKYIYSRNCACIPNCKSIYFFLCGFIELILQTVVMMKYWYRFSVFLKFWREANGGVIIIGCNMNMYTCSKTSSSFVRLDLSWEVNMFFDEYVDLLKNLVSFVGCVMGRDLSICVNNKQWVINIGYTVFGFLE